MVDKENYEINSYGNKIDVSSIDHGQRLTPTGRLETWFLSKKGGKFQEAFTGFFKGRKSVAWGLFGRKDREEDRADPRSVLNEFMHCVSCQSAKQPALSFSSSHSHSTAPFDIVHFDVWGPSPIPTMRGSRHILDSVRALLISSSCPERFWGEVTLTAIYLINHIPSSVLNNQSPYERLHGTSKELYNASPHASTSYVEDDLLAGNALDNFEPSSTSSSISPVDSTNELVVPSSSHLTRMDVKNAFLNGDLEEEVYMKPSPGLNHPPNKVCRLRRALYGLKQSPRTWYAKFSATIMTSSHDGYMLSQVKYASDLVSKVELNDGKSVSTPLKPNVKLTPMDGFPLSDPTRYRQLVGSLVYLTTIRPDIAYAVHIVSQFMTAPRSTHYVAVLRIIRYVKGTLFHGLHFLPTPPLCFALTLMLIGLVILLIVDLPLVTVFSLVILLSLGGVRNKLFHLALVLKLSIELSGIPHQNFFHCGGFLKIWAFLNLLLLIYIVIIKVLCRLLIVMSFMNALNTLRPLYQGSFSWTHY
ncbi:hypothetical protein SLEP1_g42734 [Rubroshorea leprosula]|uniref:Reverse transcriptase Ty1/copia-type domain-containing protein n=1 Tax=Rubroshorea leprosula TaxID=152421 RepID=A0AAV5LBG9_9ROSI|nr:hypothetical protein SLEP1_g42734 [Rubroshorea leprosula]